MDSPHSDAALAGFSRPVRTWFDETFGHPTPPQAQGWPAISRGDHTLILAPTGSGKTLTAFLSGVDDLCRELSAEGSHAPGVRIVYVSPLKALNNDIYRNLRHPLVCIHKVAQQIGAPFPDIRLAVRSGDTPSRERQAMLRRPPHILITTPESLYLLLTSPRAREMFRAVRTLILDEIHTLVGSKRGVHLAVSVERLTDLAEGHVQRIGLSATIRPLEEAARFLGGADWQPNAGGGAPGEQLVPRPVTIVDAHYRKPMDLEVVTPVADFRDLPGGSIWPAIVPEVARLIRGHRSTLIFCNNRRLAEQTADRLNEHLAAEESGLASPLIQDGVAKGLGFMAVGVGRNVGPIRAHHGSVSREPRLQMEQDLKAGNLPALVATSSLELGIDIGAVDLVVQLQSPKSVAQGLQRVGRSGHLVGQTSKGRVFPTFREDLMEIAAATGAMLRGEVEPTSCPHSPLDVLAQQIVAMVSVDGWEVDALLRLIRRAYPYRNLSQPALNSVLEMLAGRFMKAAQRELQPRIAWDRVNNRLMPLPGSRGLATTNGGTIPDRGTFGAYLTDGKTKLGELDEEFVFETRKGDVFMLGSQTWRVTEITDDRITVAPAPGEMPRMPFWHGDYPWRPYELGREIGAFRRIVADRLEAEVGPGANVRTLLERRGEGPEPQVIGWLRREHALDENSAWLVVDYVAGQLDSAGAISSDRRIVLEVFENDLGQPLLVIHSPFGGRVNGPWALALAGILRDETGVDMEVQSNDDGIVLRFDEGAAESFPLDLVRRLGPVEARERVLRDLPGSAVFGARFRQNAARALLLPGNRPGRRTPFWLQRLRARDLLQAVHRFDDFPILIETYRDCLEDVMDLPHLEQVLGAIQQGEIQVQMLESLTPSPVAQGLMMQFTNAYFHEWDAPKAERQLQQLSVDRVLLQDLLKDVALDEMLRPEAIDDVVERLQHVANNSRARTADELAVLLDELGDLTAAEIVSRSAVEPSAWMARLADQDRVVQIDVPTSAGFEQRWVPAERESEYRAAFGTDSETEGARRNILSTLLAQSGPLSLEQIRARYGLPVDWLKAELDRRAAAGEIARGRFRAGFPADQYLDRRNFEQIHRHTLTVLRKEVRPVPRTVYADFLAHWQHLSPGTRLKGRGAINEALQQLRAMPILGRAWERDVLPLRLERYDAGELEALCGSGEVIWIGVGGSDPRRGRVRFLFRGEGRAYLEPEVDKLDAVSSEARAIYDLLKSEGALFHADLQAVVALDDDRLDRGLVELMLSGLVTNDSLHAVRHLIAMGSVASRGRRHEQTVQRRPFSSLEAQLSERLGDRGIGAFRSRREAYRDARRRLAERVTRPDHLSWMGRWSLVYQLGIMGREISVEERTTRQARQLLQRWGVVTREAVEAEGVGWDWAALYGHLRLLEMRGDVRRGYFVEGLPGLQFALPEAVEQLRSRRAAAGADEPPVVMSAVDPANLYGSEADGAATDSAGRPLTFARHPSTYLVQQSGFPILIARGGGASLTAAQGASDEAVRRGLQGLLEHLTRNRRHVTVESWNGQDVLTSAEGLASLESLGFRRDYPSMTWERRR